MLLGRGKAADLENNEAVACNGTGLRHMPAQETQVFQGKTQVFKVSEEQLGVLLFSKGQEVTPDQSAPDRSRVEVGEVGTAVSCHVSSREFGSRFENGLFARHKSPVNKTICAELC